MHEPQWYRHYQPPLQADDDDVVGIPLQNFLLSQVIRCIRSASLIYCHISLHTPTGSTEPNQPPRFPELAKCPWIMSKTESGPSDDSGMCIGPRISADGQICSWGLWPSYPSPRLQHRARYCKSTWAPGLPSPSDPSSHLGLGHVWPTEHDQTWLCTSSSQGLGHVWPTERDRTWRCTSSSQGSKRFCMFVLIFLDLLSFTMGRTFPRCCSYSLGLKLRDVWSLWPKPAKPQQEQTWQQETKNAYGCKPLRFGSLFLTSLQLKLLAVTPI